MTGDLTLETFLFSNWSLNLISFSIDEITNKEREKEAYLHYFRIVEETEYYPDSVWKNIRMSCAQVNAIKEMNCLSFQII